MLDTLQINENSMVGSSLSKIFDGFNSTGNNIGFKPISIRPIIKYHYVSGFSEQTYISVHDENREFMISIANDFQAALVKKGITLGNFEKELERNT